MGLGYDISARLPQTTAAMGITAESLRRKIRRIERIADHEDGTLQVYLIELDSVTQEAINGIARSLRNRAGHYLLVLTSDYEELDIVLLQLELPPARPGSLAPPQVIVRPHRLTMKRRDPDKVELRVLRRFTYTEADAEAQYEKLLSAYVVAAWAEPYFNNRALFSDYYLKERLPERPEWGENPKPVYTQLQTLYDRARERFAGADEAAVRRDLIEPVLAALGFRVRSAKGDTETPDYTLGSAEGNGPLAACLAYTWDRSLDGKDESHGEARRDDNPGARVVSVLESGPAPWAIVTNGKLWRLYAAAAASRATSYYEIDLEEALASSEPQEAFRYFWLLFRTHAFQPTIRTLEGESRELSFLDLLLHESAQYAKRLGERLKDRVFLEVFPELARGFIAHIRRVDGAAADLSQERLDEILALGHEADQGAAGLSPAGQELMKIWNDLDAGLIKDTHEAYDEAERRVRERGAEA